MNRQTDLHTMRLRPAHFRVLLVASLGQFLGQGLATIVGIIIPLIQLSSDTPLSSGLEGILGCISLIGIMAGSVVVGHLCDRYGYLKLFRLCPALCGLAALAVVLFPNVSLLVFALFIMGFAVGGEYSLDPNYISELMPDRWKAFMVGVAKALASAGSAVVAIICYFVIKDVASADVWPRLMLVIAGICALMFVLRLDFAQSPQWLMEQGRRKQAEAAVEKLLGPDVELGSDEAANGDAAEAQKVDMSVARFIVLRLRKVILTGVPWACEGLGVYGIGIFLPILVMALGLDTGWEGQTPVHHVAHSVWMTFILCLVMMVGFGIGLAISRKVNHIRMQIAGFWLSVAGLGLLMAAYILHWHISLAIAGFVLFELALNAGPHLITFVLPSQVFTSAERGTGAGVAASLGKSGAVIAAFCIPLILRQWGVVGVLSVSIAVMSAGALVTWVFSRGLNLQNNDKNNRQNN